MHRLEIHYYNAKGTKATGAGAPGSIMVATWLYIDGKPVVDGTSEPEVEWALRGATPTGFMHLEIVDPPEELSARFSAKEVLEGTNEELLLLPVRHIEFKQIER
jgi:hypothetical protein